MNRQDQAWENHLAAQRREAERRQEYKKHLPPYAYNWATFNPADYEIVERAIGSTIKVNDCVVSPVAWHVKSQSSPSLVGIVNGDKIVRYAPVVAPGWEHQRVEGTWGRTNVRYDAWYTLQAGDKIVIGKTLYVAV